MLDNVGDATRNSKATFLYGFLPTDMEVLFDQQELIYNKLNKKSILLEFFVQSEIRSIPFC